MLRVRLSRGANGAESGEVEDGEKMEIDEHIIDAEGGRPDCYIGSLSRDRIFKAC